VLVEYALVLALLLVGSLGVIRFLEGEAADEVDEEAECMSMRPPPPGCQPRAVTTSTSLVGPTTTNSTTTTIVPVASIAWQDSRSEVVTVDTWDAVTEPEVTAPDSDGLSQPVQGATVQVEAVVTQPPPESTPFFLTCVTDATGRCELRFTTPFPGVQRVEYRNPTVTVPGMDIGPIPTPPGFTAP